MCDKKEKILYFNTVVKSVRIAGAVKVDRMCNSFEAINIGSDVATINGIPLNPPAAGEVLGDSFVFGGLKGEIFIGRINVAFATVVAPQVLIIEKIYQPDQESTISEELNR
jgi:hypothetical protein